MQKKTKKINGLEKMRIGIEILSHSLRGIADSLKDATESLKSLKGGLTQAIPAEEIKAILEKVHGETAEGKQDGTRVHLHYLSFGKATLQAIQNASRADELGLPKNRYTGRILKIWKSKAGDQCLTMEVELERDHLPRTFNLDKGILVRFVVLGE